MKSVNKFVAALFRSQESTENERGNQVFRAFMPGERYMIDFADDFTAEGWEQFDTDQDASYFGVWLNKQLRQTLTYAEGDWTLVVCPDRDCYLAEVRDCIRFYGEGFIAKAWDEDGTKTTYRQDRERFLAE